MLAAADQNAGRALNRRLASWERANSRGDATRQDLLMTADSFAEHGIEAVPLRDIGIAAERGGYRGPESMGIPSASVATLRSLLGRLLPAHPVAVLDERWMVLMTSTINTLARYQAVLVSGTDLGSPIEALLEDLVRFLTAGLEAPAAPARRTAAASGGGRGKTA